VVSLAILACGCAGTAPPFENVESGRSDAGTLEARVVGAGGDVSFFVDGEKVRTVDGWSWWKDARLVHELAAGTHAVEARFSMGRFAGRELSSRIVTREQIPIEAGRRTRLVADLRGEWTDPPEERVFTFQVMPPRTREQVDLAGGTGPTTEQVPVEVRLAWLDPGLVSELEGAAGPDVPLVPLPEGGPLAPAQITIRGDEVVAAARRPPPGRPRTSAPQSGAASTLRSLAASPPPGDTEVVLLVETEPAGAHASLDDAYLGRTPVRVRLDPRIDHVLQLEREGCETRVQLLASTDWKTGRSPRVVQRLECR
jgi:hypothetical protein